MTGRLGVLAGGGRLPGRVIEAARATGRDVFALGFEGHTDPATLAGVPHAWVRLGAAGEVFRHLREAGVVDICLAGPVKRPSLGELRPDWRGAQFLARVGARAFGDDGLLSAIVREIEAEGFRVVGADELLGELLTPLGTLGAVAPPPEAAGDIARGLAVLAALGPVDVGQAVVVQQGVVLGVEAVEGTASLLARAGTLRRPGFGGVLVKAAKPGQERRVDLPAIGADTVTQAAEAGIAGIALEAARTLIIDRTATIAASDRAGLFVVGVAA